MKSCRKYIRTQWYYIIHKAWNRCGNRVSNGHCYPSPPHATTRRCWQLWQTRITMLVYIVACYSGRRLVNIMTIEKERYRKEKLRLHRTSKVKLGWPQKAEGKCGGYCWMNGMIAWMLHTCQVSRASACERSLVISCKDPSRSESSVISYIDHTGF